MADVRKQTRPQKLKPPVLPSASSVIPEKKLKLKNVPNSIASPASTSTSPASTSTSPALTSTSSASTSAVSSILRSALILANIVPENCPPPPPSDDISPPSPIGIIDSDDSSSSSLLSSSSSTTRPSTPSTPSPTRPSTPSPIRPSVICTTQSPSEKFQHLQALRKKCIRPAQQCSYIFKKGAKKGERCVKRCILNEGTCSLHLKLNHSASPSSPRPTVEATKIRINRLCKNKRYFFFKIKDFAKVLVQCEGKLYSVELPRGMDLHVEDLSKKDYLIRNDSGTTVWKRLE